MSASFDFPEEELPVGDDEELNCFLSAFPYPRLKSGSNEAPGMAMVRRHRSSYSSSRRGY